MVVVGVAVWVWVGVGVGVCVWVGVGVGVVVWVGVGVEVVVEVKLACEDRPLSMFWSKDQRSRLRQARLLSGT